MYKKMQPTRHRKMHAGAKRIRRCSGNTLALVLALLLGFLLVLLIFGLKYTRFLGAHLEQRTAMEAAALASARDLGRIVIEDPYFGFVGLSDNPPTGTGTTAGDDYYMPVTGINTLLATVRLDLIISDYVNDPLMRILATDDYNRAIQAKDTLVAALNAAVQPGGSGRDFDGNTINPNQEAIDTYNSNSIRLTGQASNLVPGSMKLTLGYVDDLTTNTVIPQPVGTAQLTLGKQEQNGFYKANVSAPYAGLQFVFAGLGDDTTLVDQKVFKPTIGGVPYSIPTVVKCEADQSFADHDERGLPVNRVVHATAAAEAASARDRRPAPGTFTISYPDSDIPEIKHAGDLMTDGQIILSPCDKVQMALAGDYPGSALTDYPIPELLVLSKDHPVYGSAISIAFYDWIRRGGTKLSVKAVIDMLNNSLTAGAAGQMHQFQITPEGNIDYKVVGAQNVTLPVSHKQWRAIEGLGYASSNKHVYDITLTDFVYQPGRIQGGLHGGEPLNGKLMPGTPPVGVTGAPVQTFYPPGGLPYFAFLTGPGGGAFRPTYQKTAMAVDITFRQRQ